jgi:hypothetical protein
MLADDDHDGDLDISDSWSYHENIGNVTHPVFERRPDRSEAAEVCGSDPTCRPQWIWAPRRVGEPAAWLYSLTYLKLRIAKMMPMSPTFSAQSPPFNSLSIEGKLGD